MSSQQWQSGPPSADTKLYKLYFVIYKNGARVVAYGHEIENSPQVICHLPIPEPPELKYNPRVFQEPNYGLWVGEYSLKYPIESEVPHE